MADIKHLRLVLPDALTHLRELRTCASLVEVPATLRMLLQRGAVKRLWSGDELDSARLDPWQQSLLSALPPQVRSHGLASAALSWRGEGGILNGGSWLQVEPVHLTAGLEDLRLGFPPPLTNDEAQQLAASLQPLFSLAGFEFQVAPSGRWFLWRADELDVVTYSPRSGFATRVYDIMPQGSHGAELRRLMTEAQMLLHQHPVNLRREQRQVPTVNGLWLWGAGSLDVVGSVIKERVLSHRAYVQGLCEHLHIACWPLPPDAAALLTLKDDDVIAVVACESLAELDQTWLQPITTALHSGQVAHLDLYLDQWCVTLKGGRWQQLRRMLMSSAHELTEILA